MLLLIHILGGAVGIVAGYVALFSPKGARLHRKAGLLFVCAMAVMGISATVLAVLHGVEASMFGGLLVAYLVITALTTVRPSTPASRRLDFGLMVLALGTGAGLMIVGFQALASPGGTLDEIPAPPIFMNGVIALLSGVGDLRAMRSGGLRGASRLARHLWRMCFALFIAAGSFFLGQADEFPEALRVFPLLAILAFLPLLAMLYWLWRVRAGRRARSIVEVGMPQPARTAHRTTDAPVPVG